MAGRLTDGLDCLLNGGSRTLHVIAPTRIKGAESIGIIFGEAPIRAGLAEPELAAHTLIANLLLNLDETVTRN